MVLLMRARLRALLPAALALTVVLLNPSPGRGGSTTPELAVGEVTISPAGQTSVVEITGTWAFDDIMQVDFPLNIVVSQGSTFVRYEVGAGPESGAFAGLGDGLSVGEIPALEAAGSPDETARFVILSPHRIVLSVPDSIGNGPVTVRAYVVVPDYMVISNPVTATLSGAGGGS